MKIIKCTEMQQNLLRKLHPYGDNLLYLALVPAGEYYFWARRFLNLLDSLSGHFHTLRLPSITRVPVVQCTSKFVSQSAEGYLIPKTFKFSTLSEGTQRDFGFARHMIPLMQTLDFPYPCMNIPDPPAKTRDILGFLAWDEKHPPLRGAETLPRYVKCTGNISEVEIDSGCLVFQGKEYQHVLPTFRYWPDKNFQRKLLQLQEARKLLVPTDFPLSNLRNLTEFRNPCWAQVKPLEFFLEESPENLQDYVLIRIDDGKIVTWDEAMRDPKLKLEMEMSDYWLWQEACATTEHLQYINMYWEFGSNYPWLVDKRTNTVIPTYIVED